jgi:hypothetical protein
LFNTIQSTRAYPLLRRFGRWDWFEQTVAQLPPYDGVNGTHTEEDGQQH